MKLFKDISLFLEKYTQISSEYFYLTFIIIITFIIMRLCIKILCSIYNYFNKDSKSRFIFNNKIKIIGNLCFFLILLFVLQEYIKDIITIISFISAGVTIALRDVIINFFAGIYIKIKKPFILEDRIKIGEIEGDVVNMNMMSFDLLEVNTKSYDQQSTGIITHFPNSLVLTSPIKNYVKAFKYIWHEINIKIDINSDIKKTKGIIYKILNQNDVIKNIPNKMKRQLNAASSEYRIYYNKFDPIIYTRIVNNYIELSIRFLIHPKKIRTVEDDIYMQILIENNKGELTLYKD